MEKSTSLIFLTIANAAFMSITIIYNIYKNKRMKQHMITENEVPDILGEELPELNFDLEKVSAGGNIYNVLQSFAGYTKRCADLGNMKKLKSCFLTADKLMSKGNNLVKSAMENVYVFSVSSLLEIVSPIQEQVKKMFPENLKIAYTKQIIACYP